MSGADPAARGSPPRHPAAPVSAVPGAPPGHPAAPVPAALRPGEQRALAAIGAELRRVVRYDDESIVHEGWLMQRYDSGRYRTLGDARRATVATAWHEAGHAVAALTLGARFSSASVRPGRDTEGRVHGIRGTGDLAFVIDAAGQIAERLRAWTLLDDDRLREWLSAWRGDGGDARRFRAGIRPRFGSDEFAAWRYSESLLVPERLRIRQVARALLVHPRHIPQAVVAAIAADC